MIKRLIIPVFALMLALPLPVIACSTTQTITLDTDNRWEGGREDLYKSLRYTVSRTPSDGNYLSVKVEYQKEKRLLCQIVPGGTDICSWFLGTEFAIDNRNKLEDWHTSINYTKIKLGTADTAGDATFVQDYISGIFNPSTNTLKTLTVNSTGRVVFSKPAGDITLTGC